MWWLLCCYVVVVEVLVLCCFSGEGGQCHVEVCCSNDGCDVVCLMLFLMLFAVVLLNCSGKFC